MVAHGETDPLLSPSSSARMNGKYYFLNKQDTGYQGGTTSSVRDGDGLPVVQVPPDGTTDHEFAPRPVLVSASASASAVTGINSRYNNKQQQQLQQHTLHQIVGQTQQQAGTNGGIGGIFAKLLTTVGSHLPNFSSNNPGNSSSNMNPSIRGGFGDGVGSGGGGAVRVLKTRKAPIKIEPKVFFANERTFLAWMHLSVILAGASIAILAFAEDTNPMAQLYGIILLPVAIAFILYSMYQYGRRARMIRHRHPGPYEDTVGPVVLGILLMCSIVAQFALKLYSMSQ